MPANLRENLRDTLAQPPGADLPAIATELLAQLGYRSERGLALPPADGPGFLRQFPAPTPGAPTERAFADAASSIQILFQLTDREIARAISDETQHSLFDATAGSATAGSAPDAANGFDTGNARSFLFVAVELSGSDYPRGHYAAFTRELNKRLLAPTVALFRTADHRLTLAFIHRRPNRHDPDRDVMGRVSLVREIDPDNPHRAHLDILAQLALPDRLRWIADHGKPRNFDGLLDAWLDALDTEELNRRFYRELFVWFQHAVDTARFPADPKRTLPAEEHVIRLITRLLFVWFIKEKGLVSGQLFIENRVAALLQDYDRAHGDSYYRAILQNLFFATLNTEIAQRRFSSQTREDHRNFSVYRYRDEIADPDRLQDLLAQTPLINGGLFDCLDSFDSAGQGGVRIDCFTDNPSHRAGLSIPNRLFFGDPDQPGLIDLFHRYKFTIEENTPAEREVALDPELLGKVFENLLAAVNPETRRTARQETGSYYTPRPVVDYMVDQALIGALTPIAFPDAPDADGNANLAPNAAARLRYLLDYDDAFDDPESLFTPNEKARLVRAIADLKALDPAVGSGAFPMGILHKLTLALRRLDPGNRIWEQVQREQAAQRANAAFDTADQAARDAELVEISAIFEQYRDSDYGRKLYLIQNSIYGVDLQPIAVQIAKLRFFISLAIEQQPNHDPAANYGIKPLPNLETRFVAADTLLALERPPQRTLGQTDAVTRLEREIAANRERHFHASHRQAKLQCRRADTRLRRQLAQELRAAGFPAASAGQIAQWEPFDQNAPAAPWFDPEYMFGVPHGFDLVIANPPYVRQEDISPKPYKDTLLQAYSDAAVGRSDLYCYFYARGLQLLRPRGMHVFVCSNSWLDVGYGAKLQQYLLTNAALEAVYESAIERQFITADINTIISVLRKTDAPAPDAPTRFVQLREDFEAALSPGGRRREIVKTRAQLLNAATAAAKFTGDKWGGKYLRAPDIYHHILDQYGARLARLGDIATVRFGIKTGVNEFFYLTPEVIEEWGIEAQYRRPVMTTPQESRSLAVNPAALPKQLFMCHQDRPDLKGTAALAYIQWGESQNHHQRTSVKSRRRWYDLGTNLETKLAFGCRVDTTSRTLIAVNGLCFDKAFYKIDSQSVPLAQLCASLNSTLTQLMINIEGRTNFGGGLLEIEVYETQNLPIVKSQYLPNFDPAIFQAKNWDLLQPSKERQELDTAIYDALGLTAGEREAVQAGVSELVNNRKRRARSAAGGRA